MADYLSPQEADDVHLPFWQTVWWGLFGWAAIFFYELAGRSPADRP